MINTQPKLSIGLPVYNGERFLPQSLDSLLGQTFTDFELIISDNASTDNTEEICRVYAAKDRRIRYYRHPQNIGCACNFNHVFQLARGEYFKWAAYDDLHAPEFLQRCVEILDQDATIILCHSQTYFIDEQGSFFKTYDIKLRTDAEQPQERFDELLTKHLCYQMYGVIRHSALKRIPPMGGYGNADGIFLLRLGMLGKFYEIPEYLFFARSHPQQSMSMFFPNYLTFTNNNPQYSLNMLPDYYGYSVWFDSRNKGKILFPHWRMFWEYLRSVNYGSLSFYQRLCCYLSIFNRLADAGMLLIDDLFFVAKMRKAN